MRGSLFPSLSPPLLLNGHIMQNILTAQDHCSHGTGSLSAGDIEDIDPKAVACGSLPKKTACVRCPRHQQKFAGTSLCAMPIDTLINTHARIHVPTWCKVLERSLTLSGVI